MCNPWTASDGLRRALLAGEVPGRASEVAGAGAPLGPAANPSRFAGSPIYAEAAAGAVGPTVQRFDVAGGAEAWEPQLNRARSASVPPTAFCRFLARSEDLFHNI